MKINTSKKHIFGVAGIVGVGLVLGALILGIGKTKSMEERKDQPNAEQTDAKQPTSKESNKGEASKTLHGGKLFVKGNAGIEVVLAEDGGAPRFRVYLTDRSKPLAPDAGKVAITLTRPDGEKQEFRFIAENDYLKSTNSVAEPHVFDASVNAQIGKESLAFTFSKEEGKVKLSDAQIKDSGVVVQISGAARIQDVLRLPGEIRFNLDKTAQIVPRVAGVVTAVYADLGQQVKKGQVLASMSSSTLSDLRSELLASERRNALAKVTFEREKKLWEERISAQQDYLQAQQVMRETEIAVQNGQQKLQALGATPVGAGALSQFEIRAPFDGMVTEKHIALGESVKEDANVFIVSDLSSVWAEIAISAKDLNAVRMGATASVLATAFDSKAPGVVSYVGSLLGEQTRTAKARVTLTNPQLVWRPGMFVSVDIVTGTIDAAVAVSSDAIQTVNDKPTVFTKVTGGFVAQPVTIGQADGKMVEIVTGMKPGTPYASVGTFVLKAELGKASLEND